MNHSQKSILAIAPGKREIGIAVFVGFDLVYASVKTIHHGKSKKITVEEITRLLQKLFESFAVQIIVTKAISQYQTLSPDLEKLVGCIRFECEQKEICVAEVSLEEIKRVLCDGGVKATEKKAFEMLLSAYPELEQYWNRPNKWQNDYYAFLFSAVAVGAVYLKTDFDKD
jgi:RNase H-fold protein (predicted Holliday junction resolvase)